MKRIGNLLLCFLLVIAMAISVYAATSVPETVIEATQSVVRILSEYSTGYATGSGFVIKCDLNETLILTNYHVVDDDPSSISVWLTDEDSISASILTYSTQKDLCILKLSFPVALQALIFSEHSAKRGDAVYAVGFPGAADSLSDKEAHTSADATITDGIVSAVREATVSDYGTPTKILQINAAINSGNSGGPLFNAEGEVVGINTYGTNNSQGIFAAIDISEVKNFLSDHSIPIPMKERNISLFILVIASVITLCIVTLCTLFALRRRRKLPINVDTNHTHPKDCTVTYADTVEVNDNTHPPASPSVNDESNLTVATPTKNPPAPIKIYVTVVIIILAISLSCVYFVCYSNAKADARSGDFTGADNLLFVPSITKLHDEELTNYISAGLLMESRRYKEASVAFEKLSGYLNADEMARESKYRQALQYADANNFADATSIMTELSKVGYKDSAGMLLELQYREGVYFLYEENNYMVASEIFAQLIRKGYDAEEMENQALYLWALDLIDNKHYIYAYHQFLSIQDYSDVADQILVLSELMYAEAQFLYKDNRFDEAKELFDCIQDYSDSSKYLTLIYVHQWADSWNVTLDMMNDLIEIFNFEDASELLLSTPHLAKLFLSGTWSNKGNHFTLDKDGHIKYNLPYFDYGDYYKIEDGILSLYPKHNEKAAKPLFRFTAISPDCIEVFCYQNGKIYVLFRQ